MWPTWPLSARSHSPARDVDTQVRIKQCKSCLAISPVQEQGLCVFGQNERAGQWGGGCTEGRTLLCDPEGVRATFWSLDGHSCPPPRLECDIICHQGATLILKLKHKPCSPQRGVIEWWVEAVQKWVAGMKRRRSLEKLPSKQTPEAEGERPLRAFTLTPAGNTPKQFPICNDRL